MGRFLKEKKVVIILSGRYAGKKAVIVKNFDEGDPTRPFGHALVAGVERCPLKVTKGMNKKLIAKRSRVKPFLKVVNYNHLMPTRYTLDVSIDKEVVTKGCVKDRDAKFAARKEIRAKFQERHRSGTNPWFFQKLRF
eukprot:m.1637108 g.1637108  ORF g.1637108 m.1637108 type:complete len:137 (+) comp25464_c0_seq1:66-476(+)